LTKLCAELASSGSLNCTFTVVESNAVTLAMLGGVMSGGMKLNPACELDVIALGGLARSVTLLTVSV